MSRPSSASSSGSRPIVRGGRGGGGRTRRTDVDDEQPPRDAVALAERAQREAARELQRADRVDQQGAVAYGFAVTFGRVRVLLTALLDRVLDRRDAAPREDRAMPARGRRSGGAGPGSDEALARPPLGGRRIPGTSRANTRDAGKTHSRRIARMLSKVRKIWGCAGPPAFSIVDRRGSSSIART